MAYQNHGTSIADWLLRSGIMYKVTSVMDTSTMGMSFLYSFEKEDAATLFKLRFGHFCTQEHA